MKILITDRFLRSIKPTGKRRVFWDAAVPGHCVIVTGKGKIDFAVIRRLPGERVPKTWRLGQYPIIGLADGRKAALGALLDIGRGVDPKEKEDALRRAEAHRQANCLAAVGEEFIARHVANLSRASEAEAAIRRELISRWGPLSISDVDRRHVVAMVREISDSGRPSAARKNLAYASKLFNWAVARGLLEKSPCAGIRASEIIGRKEPRRHVLDDTEIRAVWTATDGLGYPLAPFVKLLWITGQRLREVAEMVWSEVDLNKALWTIPPERMKGGTAHEVPLPPDAIDILKSLPRWSEPFVFSTTGGKRPISGFSKAKRRIDAAMKVPIAPWRFHDARRSMRTGLSALPVPNNVAELCIAHAQHGLHRTYDLHSYRDEKRRAFELWSARLASIVALQNEDKVVKFRF